MNEPEVQFIGTSPESATAVGFTNSEDAARWLSGSDFGSRLWEVDVNFIQEMLAKVVPATLSLEPLAREAEPTVEDGPSGAAAKRK